MSSHAASKTDPLPGRGLQQSREEWDTRNRVLAETMGVLIDRFLPATAKRALDVGCQRGALTDVWMARTGLEWWGIDPSLTHDVTSPAGAHLSHGYANELRFPDEEFDCAVFANVYEHVLPEQRADSLAEIRRVLKPGGIVVGQIPNPYFPIESHSRLPFMGWLPIRAQKAYWKLTPVPWEHDFFVVTLKHLRRDANRVGLDVALEQNFNYPTEVIPQQVRWAARLFERPMQHVPWAWQFVLRRPV
jgi:SAM-dependent methyltransferase